MVQFHWSQHLLSNVVLVSFKHPRTFLITMPDGLAIKTFAFSLSPLNPLLIFYGLEFEYKYTEANFFFFWKKQITSGITNLPTALSVLQLSHAFPNIMWKNEKEGSKGKVSSLPPQKKLFPNYKQDTVKLRSEEKGNPYDLPPSFHFEIWGRQNQLVWADSAR